MSGDWGLREWISETLNNLLVIMYIQGICVYKVTELVVGTEVGWKLGWRSSPSGDCTFHCLVLFYVLLTIVPWFKKGQTHLNLRTWGTE